MTSDPFGRSEVEYHEGYPRYSAAEMQRRHTWLAATMEQHGLDAVVVGGATAPLETSVQFFTNWPPQVTSYVVFRRGEEPVLFVRLWNHLPDAERIAVIDRVVYGGDTPLDQVVNVAKSLAGCRSVGLIGSIPFDEGEVLRREVGEGLKSLAVDYQRFRLVKSEEEMVFTRIASRMNDAAVAALAEELRPGMNELEVGRIVESVYLDEGGVDLIHFSLTTPMDAPRYQVPHQYQPDRTIRAGDVFVTEISTTFWGYAGQILRTFTIGADATPRYARLFEVASAVYEGIVGRLRVGATVGEILDVADAIAAEGLDIWDDLVHGFGGAYLPPIVRTRSSRGATHPDEWAYPDGTLLVVQPNVVEDTAGVQVGNSMWLTSDGVEVTQAYPMGLIRCG